MKNILAILSIQAIALVSFAKVQNPLQAVVDSIRADKEIHSLISVIEKSRSLQKCIGPDANEVVLLNTTKYSADFEAQYSCETMIITIKGKAEMSFTGVVAVQLTELSL